MQTASLLADHFNDVLCRLPPDLDLDALAFDTKAIERRREIGDGSGVLRLALARGPGGLSLSQTAAWGATIGLADMSPPAVKFRLDKAGDFLDGVLARLMRAAPQAQPRRWPGRVLRAADGSSISGRASKGVDWRVHGVFDLGCGRFSHLGLTDCHGAESLAHGAPVAGEIRIADRNYARPAMLRDWMAHGPGRTDFIVRMSWCAFKLATQDGKPFDLIEHLTELPQDEAPHEIMLQALTGRGTEPLPLRLVLLRKTPEATEAALRKLRRQAQLKQKTLKPQTQVAAGFVILATSLPQVGYEAADILAVYRLRWQIELAFKRLKSLIHIDELPTRTPAASRSWLLSHLILAALCDDATQEVLESFP
jgi:hypothetical protein